MPFYAVAAGRTVGVYNTWKECEEQVKGFRNPNYKKFETMVEAEEYIERFSTMLLRGQNMEGEVVPPDGSEWVEVYVDGSCFNNGRPNAQAGIGVWFGPEDELNVSEPVEGPKATNNVAEIQAVTKAIKQAKLKEIENLIIYTQSEYVINIVFKWYEKWAQNNWQRLTEEQEEIKNLKDIHNLKREIGTFRFIKLKHLSCSSKEDFNIKAKELAQNGARKYEPHAPPPVKEE